MGEVAVSRVSLCVALICLYNLLMVYMHVWFAMTCVRICVWHMSACVVYL